MKKIILLSLISGSLFFTYPQNNFDFESWTNGTPTNWYANNVLTIFVPIEQSTDAHSGSFAVKGSVVPSPPSGYAPTLTTGSDLKGLPINQRILSLNGWYKFNSDSGDAFFVNVFIQKNGVTIGSGGYFSSDDVPEYKVFEARLTTNSVETPDTIRITIGISNARVHPGSEFYVDDLFYENVTDIENDIIPIEYELEQNYPNPFNPTTVIQYSVAELSTVKIIIFNALGMETAVLVNRELPRGIYSTEFNGSGLSSGIYFYRIQAGSFTDTKKFILLR